MSFKSICLITPVSSHAKQQFQFKLGDTINVLSDKGYRKIRDNSFEAVGNVIITHENQSIYGEKASMSMQTGDLNVVGHVRYIDPELTLYGSEINYNYLNNYLVIKNARVINQFYTILGKKIIRTSSGELEGENAEYTTCKDCPESWSIFGKKVKVTFGEYVKITDAYLKIKGVVVMYIPYIVFPIKKKRETGLLFPTIGLTDSEGFKFQQPFFWALGSNKDATITPSVWGKRGFGGEVEYRHILGEKKWFHLNSMLSWDTEYRDNQSISNRLFRQYGQLEQQFKFGNNWGHYLYYQSVTDLDVFRDYDYYLSKHIGGSEVIGEATVSYRSSMFDINLEAYHNRNMLFPQAEEFDSSYVQILPKLNISLMPFGFQNSNIAIIQNMFWGLDLDLTHFKQDKLDELNYIRNAYRFNAKPYMNWNIGYIGPVYLKSHINFDYQSYYFPKEERSNTFQKKGIIYETTASLELNKIFGVSYRQKIPIEKIEINEKEKPSKDNSIYIGELPELKKGKIQEYVEKNHSSYQHKQIFNLNHFYISDPSTSGSSKFYNQIVNSDSTSNSAGMFDYLDAVIGKEHELNSLESRTSLPKSNTLEIQWNNSFIKKTAKKINPFVDSAYSRNNYTYLEKFYFNISQGIDLYTKNKGEDFPSSLTRLYLSGGINIFGYDITGSEYFFHNKGTHISNLSLSKQYDFGKYSFSLTHDLLSEPVNKFATFNITFSPFDILHFSLLYDYDIDQKMNTRSFYKVSYHPYNNCWRLILNYDITQIHKQFSFNFLINFNENNFLEI